MGTRLDGRNIRITEEFDARGVVDALRDVLARVAVGGEVRVLTPNTDKDRGKVRFVFNLPDQYGVDVTVEIEEVMRDPKGYVHRMLHQIAELEQQAAERRQVETAAQIAGADGYRLGQAVRETLRAEPAGNHVFSAHNTVQ